MTDVLIIGAGPSGSIAAALLVKQGFKVLVLEKQKFPRFSIGESLLAQSLALLENAGMLEAVQAAGFQYKNGAVVVRGKNYTEFNFAQKISPGPCYTYEVQRADFDNVLIKEAERMGAEVRYEVEIIAADFSGEQPVITARSKDGRVETHRPRFVLDASGFGRTLPKLLNLEEPSDFPVRAAFYTHIEDHIEAGTHFDRQKALITVHPDHVDVWFWLIPFSNGRSSIGVVASKEFLARYQGTTWERLWQIVQETPTLAGLLTKAKPVANVGEIIGYAANVKSLHGRNFALLGNAAEFLDPVFSSGVTIAMMSATLAAPCVGRQLRGESVDWEKDFGEPVKYGVDTFRAFVNTWYDGRLQDIFFFERPETKTRLALCSVLAGYAWDRNNPLTGEAALRRLNAIARACKPTAAAA